MSSIGTGYDISASTFNPDGNIVQVDYATKCVDGSPLVPPPLVPPSMVPPLVFFCKDGLVLAVEKILPGALYSPTSNLRIVNVDNHIGFAATGLYPDAIALAEHCKIEANDYKVEYREKIPCKLLADRLSLYVHAHTLHSVTRPFGVSAFLTSWNERDGPELYVVEPSGLTYGYRGWAAGKGRQAAKTQIEKLKLGELTCLDALKEAARIIYAVREAGKAKYVFLDLSWIGEHTNEKHEIVPKQVAEEAEAYAKTLEEDDDS